MRVESLEYFLTLTKAGSMNKAAKELFISEQGLSKAIQSLEKELTVRLFIKSGRSIVLSPEGRLLVSYAERIVNERKNLLKDLRSIMEDDYCDFASLTLKVTPFVSTIMFNLLYTLLQDYNIDNCIIKELSYEELAYNLNQNNSCGLVLAGLPSSPRIDIPVTTNFIPLFSTEICIIAQKSLIPESKGSICASELATYPIAYYNESILNSCANQLLGSADSDNVILHSSNQSRITHLLDSGAAATFADTFSAYIISTKKHKKGNSVLHSLNPTPLVNIGFFIDRESSEYELQRKYVKKFQTMLSDNCHSYIDQHRVKQL